MKPEEMVNLLKGMLGKKEDVIGTLFGALEESMRIQKGLNKAKDSVIDNPSEDNLRKMLKTTMSSLETQSKAINQLVLICIVYASNSNYTSDIAQTLNKLGHGKEAMQAMFKQKMEGKF